MNDYASMVWFPYVKAWGHVPEFHDAGLCARAIVEGAMRIYMERGCLPTTPAALRRAIGADEKDFACGYEEARIAIEKLEPLWSAELADAWQRWEAIRSRNRKIAQTRRRPSGKPVVDDTFTSGGPQVVHPETTSTITSTDLAKAKSPKAPRSARSGEPAPEGFDTFWDAFRDRYPRRPGQPWSEGRKAMLKALDRHPGLDWQLLLDAAAGYRELMRATGKEGTDKVAHASTWINQDRWECDHTITATGGTPDLRGHLETDLFE